MQWTDHLELYSTCTSSTRAVTECLHTCNEDTPVLDHLAPSRCLKIPAQNTNTLTYCQQPPCLQNTKRQWRPTIQQQIWEHCQCRSDRYSPKWALIASIISAFLVPVLIWSILTHSRSTGSVSLPSYTTKPFSTSQELVIIREKTTTSQNATCKYSTNTHTTCAPWQVYVTLSSTLFNNTTENSTNDKKKL